MAKNRWARIERLLARAGHAKLLLGDTGIWAIVVTSVSGLVVGGLAKINSAPAYVVAIVALASIAMSLFSLYYLLQILRWWREPPIFANRQQARQHNRRSAGTVSPHSGTNPLLVAIIAVGVASGIGIYAINYYTTWQRDVDKTYIFPVFPATITVWADKKPQPFGVTLTGINVGNLPMISPYHNHRFEYPDRELTPEEEDRVMRGVDAALDVPPPSAGEMVPQAGVFFTFQDSRITKEQWDDFMAGKTKIYVFIEYKYSVSVYSKATEVCFFFAKF